VWHWLIQHWRSRLTAYHAALADDPDAALAWRLRIRDRILEFLVGRYEPQTLARPAVVLNERARLIILRPTLCRAVPSDEHAPRRPHALRAALDSIHTCNARKRRWWW
jgi:hypothetical protein